VATAPAENVYAEELRQVEAQARRGRTDTLTAALEAAFAAGDAVEAQRLIEQLSRTGLDDRLLMAWRDRLSTLREAAAPPTPMRALPVEGPLPRQAAEPAATAARRPLSERDAEARRLYEAAGNDIRASDMLGAVDKLQLALEADPSRSLRCQVLRSLGVAYARSGKKLETARTYRAYLDCDPKAPDRPQLERIVRDARPEKP
jgi:tetratricopeptide (TPR) repeat protein